MENIYLPAKEISQLYGIPLRTIYDRTNKKYYRINAKDEINLEDVETILREPIKRGRKMKK